MSIKDKKINLLHGKHACVAALLNPKRRVKNIYVTEKTLGELPKTNNRPAPKIVNAKEFDKLLPEDAVHQGVVIEVEPLESVDIEDISDAKILVALDQVTDPHNVGAILRSCAAFGVGGVIVPKDNAPKESGVMAKAASGALEIVPICKVTNLSRTLDNLKKEGYWVAGLDGHTDTDLHKANLTGKTVLVMGAEGKGLRKLTREHCDILVRLPINPQVESLNVSNAAAVALYQLFIAN